MQKVLVRDRSASAMAMDLSCTGTSRSGRVVRERRVRHEPASGRRRCRPAPTCLAAAKAGQVGICGGCIGWNNCSIRRDASMPSVEVSAARSASFVLGVLQCRIGTHRARARITCHANGGERFDQDATRAGLQRKGVGSWRFETITSTASCTAARLTAVPLSVRMTCDACARARCVPMRHCRTPRTNDADRAVLTSTGGIDESRRLEQMSHPMHPPQMPT